MPSAEIELFDLPSRPPCKAWSLNPWKARLALNYKGIPYHTTWIEYPDVAPKFKGVGIEPNSGNGPSYTIPVCKFPDGRYIMDSLEIAKELEKIEPEPSLHLDDPINKEVAELSPSALGPLRGVFMPLVPRAVLNPPSSEYFHRTRKETYGKSLEQYEKDEGGETAWQKATPGLQALGKLLERNEGPYFLGHTICWADLVILGALEFFRRLGEGTYDRLVAIEPAFARIYDASANLLARNDH